MYCPFCGSELPEQAKFCHNCGEKLPLSEENLSEQSDNLSLSSAQRDESNVLEPAIDESIVQNEKKKKDSGRKIAGIICFILICIFVTVFCLGSLGDSTINHHAFNPYDAKEASTISQAIEPTNPLVRSYALNAIPASHAGDYSVRQLCDVYDKLYKEWVYVNDPYVNSDSGKEYVAPASESVTLLHGDCEDYAVLTVSLVEAIGGTARVVIADNEAGEGHAYAEVYLGDFEEGVQYVIDIIEKRYGAVTVYYHIDDTGGCWLNLDYNSYYPGSKFYESVGTVLVIWSDGKYERMTLISGDSTSSNGEYTSTNVKYASVISQAIEPENSLVQSYAQSAISPSHKGDYSIQQLCDVYDKVYKKWVMVDTPVDIDNIAPASESVTTFKGNSADYAILMASLVEAIGGEARIIVAYDSNDDIHMYAEAYFADSEEDTQELIDTMALHYGRLWVSWHYDYTGVCWINLDRTAKHPGGDLFESTRGELLVRSDGSYESWA